MRTRIQGTVMKRLTLLSSALTWTLLSACTSDPEIGRQCSEQNPDIVRVLFGTIPDGVDEETGTGLAKMAQNVRFESCSSAICISTDDSRPYCALRCESDEDCSSVDGFTCRQASSFSSLSCEDWSPDTDCFTQDEEGEFTPSERPIKYCVAINREVIEERDAQAKGGDDVPAEWLCNDSFYDANDGCDCGCGILDPDCGGDTDSSRCGISDGVCELAFGDERSQTCNTGDEDNINSTGSTINATYNHCTSAEPIVVSDDNTRCQRQANSE